MKPYIHNGMKLRHAKQLHPWLVAYARTYCERNGIELTSENLLNAPCVPPLATVENSTKVENSTLNESQPGVNSTEYERYRRKSAIYGTGLAAATIEVGVLKVRKRGKPGFPAGSTFMYARELRH